MKNIECGRVNSLKQEIMSDWDKINLSGKLLTFIGLIVFLSSIGLAFYDKGSNEILKAVEVVFRSALASIFGFVLSSNLNCGKSKNINKFTRSEVYKKIDINDQECEIDIENHNYREGNSIQIIIAFTICIICILTMLIMYS
ncbi:hypothetical protein [Faecalimicrobium dakarense]|uniref:hypothetical protein n=1 Tax=Faecalimicrobium dakarense TaxID=1301100 RepID=UPI0004B2800A|nr:hypothetical protein [[Clostridium] dakarense]